MVSGETARIGQTRRDRNQFSGLGGTMATFSQSTRHHEQAPASVEGYQRRASAPDIPVIFGY